MDDKFVKALDAEIAYMDRTKDLSEEEQEKADEEWFQSTEHKILKAYIKDALLWGMKNRNK